MAVQRSLQRLLRIREIEEEQCRLAMESALGRLMEMRRLQSMAAERDGCGRRLVRVSLHGGDIAGRMAGLAESHAALEMARALTPRIWQAEQDVDRLRADFLERRVQRRQAETLLEDAAQREAGHAEKRAQQEVDEWYRSRRWTDASRTGAGQAGEVEPEHS
jgi:flagellar biosynthesis chaperone FliJ